MMQIILQTESIWLQNMVDMYYNYNRTSYSKLLVLEDNKEIIL